MDLNNNHIGTEREIFYEEENFISLPIDKKVKIV